MPTLISASRRTDIPHFFGQWFAKRREAGYVEFRNAFGVPGNTSLRNEDVLGYLFWTKFAAPFQPQLKTLRNEKIPYAFQYTVTGYNSSLELNIPKPQKVLSDFLTIRENLPSSHCIQWRYDPIVLNSTMDRAFHLKNFETLARELEGATHVVNTSFIEPYLKTIRKMDDNTVRYRPIQAERHKTVSKRYPNLPLVSADMQNFLDDLVALADSYGIQLRACANPEWKLPKSQCCSADLFHSYGNELAIQLSALPETPSRDGCCCLKSVDIGMDNTCVGGCQYCYVVSSQKVAQRNHQHHDILAKSLR